VSAPLDFAAIAGQFEAALPAHEITLTITHNQHRCYYESVRDYLTSPHSQIEPSDFIDREDYDRCLAGDELWEICWYPNTPVGSNSAYGSTLAIALAVAEREGATS
jgi:hypothetical protein